MIIANCFDM